MPSFGVTTWQTEFGIGAFATTLTTLSLSLMGWRGVAVTNVFIGNFFFIAGLAPKQNSSAETECSQIIQGIGMLISAQWEIVRGNGFAYTVLSAFGLFYAGYGAIITPSFGVKDAFGGDTVQYNNAVGFWVLSEHGWKIDMRFSG